MEFLLRTTIETGEANNNGGTNIYTIVLVQSPPYLWTASETGRDISEQYVKTTIWLLPTYKFRALTEINL